MKKILFGLVLVLSIGCNIKTPEQELAKLIEAYQNFQNDKNIDFPGGSPIARRQSRVCCYLSVCDSQTDPVKR